MMIVHRNVNWGLLSVSVLLMVVNIVRQGNVVTSEHLGKTPAIPPTPQREVMNYNPHALEELPVNEPKRMQCSKNAVKCVVGGSPVDADGPLFPKLDLVGEDWNRRQMFHPVDFIPPRTIPPATRVDVFCGTGVNGSSVEPPIGFTRTRLETISSAFIIELVLNNGGCTGALCIKKAAPYDINSSPLGSFLKGDEVSVQLVVNQLRFGPDDFRIRIVGRDVISHLLVHSNIHQGHYALSIDIASPGVYHMEAEQMYEGYAAFNEGYDGTIPMVRRPLLPLVERKGSRGEIADAQHHHPKFNLFHVNEPENGKYLRKSKFRASKHFTWDQFTFRSSTTFQCKSPTVSPHLEGLIASCEHSCFSVDCATKRPTPAGQWVRTRVNRSFPDALTPQQMAQLQFHHVHFERTDPQGIFEYRLFSDWCRRPLGGWSALSFVKVVHTKFQRTSLKVLFLGDSHLRVTSVHMRNFLASETTCPLEDHMVKSMSSKECEFWLGFNSDEPSGQPSMTVKFQYDALLERLHDTSTDGVDVFILGMGSWALGGRGNDPTALANAPPDFGRWSMAKYRGFAKRVCERVRQLLMGHPTLLVVWMAIPAYPPNTRRFAKIKGEHRTNPRIAAFNAIANDVFAGHLPHDLKKRFRVVDTFDVTYPMMHLSLDHNHHTTYAQDAILQLLLNAIVA